jgi:transcription elongation factor/antiterminator RfaH
VLVWVARHCKSKGEAMLGPSFSTEIEAQPSAWYALYTRYQHEKSVTAILSEKGFEVFCPMYSEVHRWKDRKKEVSLPLFPGYLFFANGLDRKMDLLSTPGVSAIVSVGNSPAVVPEEEISSLRIAADSHRRMVPHPYFKEGDRLRVKSGPLAGVEGILQKWKDNYRLVLFIELLGRAVGVEVEVSDLQRGVL